MLADIIIKERKEAAEKAEAAREASSSSTAAASTGEGPVLPADATSSAAVGPAHPSGGAAPASGSGESSERVVPIVVVNSPVLTGKDVFAEIPTTTTGSAVTIDLLGDSIAASDGAASVGRREAGPISNAVQVLHHALVELD